MPKKRVGVHKGGNDCALTKCIYFVGGVVRFCCSAMDYWKKMELRTKMGKEACGTTVSQLAPLVGPLCHFAMSSHKGLTIDRYVS